MSAKVCMENVFTILLVSDRYEDKMSTTRRRSGLLNLRRERKLGHVPADFLLLSRPRQLDEPSLIWAEVLHPANRDLLDGIGRPHSNQGIRIAHAVEKNWKEAGIRHDLTHDFRNCPYGPAIPPFELPQKGVH
jgi:hypothetical protein